ncbi:MAG TPA: CDP-alcohol phosphatidyltransferase family protein [Labilithrix sp.]
MRPDHVTFFHTAIGLAAGAMVGFGSRGWLYVAFGLFELRMILDCYDGVLARAKKLSSARGRALDELGDAIAYMALVTGMAVRTFREGSAPLAIAIFFLMGSLGAMAAHGCDFYKRRLTALLRGEPNAVAAELARKKALVASGTSRWLDRFGVWFDGWQFRLFEPSVKQSEPAPSHVTMPKLVLAVSLLSWDNALAILHVGVLTAHVVVACAIAVGYGLVLGTTTILLARRVLGGRA